MENTGNLESVKSIAELKFKNVFDIWQISAVNLFPSWKINILIFHLDLYLIKAKLKWIRG